MPTAKIIPAPIKALAPFKFRPTFYYGFEFEGILNGDYCWDFKAGLLNLHPKIKFGRDSSIRNIPDNCIDIEFQTPKLGENEAFALLEEILCYLIPMSEENIFQTNSSCGLHINMSERNIFKYGAQLHYYSNIIHNFDETGILKTFGREKSTYCRDFKRTNRCKTVDSIYKRIKYLDDIRDDVEYYSRVPANKKYYSVALRENPSRTHEANCRIEFRGIGNKDYHLRTKDLTDAVAHVRTVSQQAVNPILPLIQNSINAQNLVNPSLQCV